MHPLFSNSIYDANQDAVRLAPLGSSSRRKEHQVYPTLLVLGPNANEGHDGWGSMVLRPELRTSTSEDFQSLAPVHCQLPESFSLLRGIRPAPWVIAISPSMNSHRRRNSKADTSTDNYDQ